MRITITLVLFLVSAFHLSAQNTLSVGYLGHVFIRPGVTLGLEIPLKTLEREKMDGEVEAVKTRQFFVRPSVGTFTRSRFYTSTLLDVAGGWNWNKSTSKFGSSLSFGFGVLAQNEVIRIQTNFKGDITERDKELRGYFLPSIKYSLHKKLSENIGLYTQWSYGMKLSPTRVRSAIFFMELGFRYSLQSKAPAND